MEPITLKPLRKQGRTTGIFHSINKTGSNMNRSVKFFAFLLVAAAMVVSGCGGNVKVKGTVKFANGEPLPGGVVNFTDGQKNYRGEINTDGTMQQPILKSWQAAVEDAINNQMTAAGELSNVEGSGCKFFINPAQNVLATSKVEGTLKVRPFGYARDIIVNIGFLTANS